MADKGHPVAFLSLFLKYRRRPWPRWVPSEYGEKPAARVGPGRVRSTFINHATVLIQTDSCNILTDPIWSNRCSPVSWAGPRRHRNPGIRIEDLPPIDVVLISHNHYDHMDLPTLRRLQEEHSPAIVAGARNRVYLEQKGLQRVTDLDWWDQVKIGGSLPVTFVPAKHFSGRGLWDRNRTLWGGFVIESSAGLIYFAGDTGYSSHFREIARRFGPMDLSFLPIGAYEPRSFMCPVHMNPPEAVQAHLDLHCKASVGIHFGTFRLSFEGIDDPAADLARARDAAGLAPGDFAVPEFGVFRETAALQAPSASSPRFEPEAGL